MSQRLIFTNEVLLTIDRLIAEGAYNKVVWVADTHTYQLLSHQGTTIVVNAGEQHKTLATVCHIWQAMHGLGITRSSLVINFGGGMVTDVAGFAAATYKRGVPFINVPTTLLAAVDAAVGGKTGFDYQGLKNQIGVVCPAQAVIVSTCFFDSLPQQQLKSGFAEMLKHALLSDRDHLLALLDHDFHAPIDHSTLLQQLQASVQVKWDIVARDPYEQGLRQALNLGHTVGHALESWALQQRHPVPHGYAVAWGLVVEGILSHWQLGASSDLLHRLAQFVRNHYGAPPITCDDYPTLLDLMRHDKKSRHGEITCTLLAHCGDYRIAQVIQPDQMTAALDVFRDLMGI